MKHPAPLTLHLHGSARAVATDGSSLALRGRAAALVAWVALDGSVSRERAAQLLWPDSPNPRQSLRQQLLRFRQALGTALLQGDSTLMLAAGVVLAAAAPGALLLADEAATEEGFGPWLAEQRQRQRQQQIEPIQQALAGAEEAGDLDQALAHAQALLAHDGHDEQHHAALMRVHYLRGEQAAGLAVFERLSAMLKQDLATSPAAATRQLAQALRRGAPATSSSASNIAQATLPLVLKRPPLLAGREAELAAVRGAWQQGLAVLIEGEAGLGKSRLVAELTAGDPQAWLMSGRPGDSGAPYATLARLLAARPQADQRVSASAQHSLQCLNGTSAKHTSPLRPGALASALAELLQNHAVHTLVLDDLHFADDATIELVAGLVSSGDNSASRSSNISLRWLFAQRPAEAPAPSARLRDALLEQQRLHVVALAPLQPAAAQALVDALAIPNLHGATLAAALVRHTGGNPLFMLVTLKQGLADGSLARGELPRPANVGALIERRLQRLSEGALNLARVAAIAGADFSIELAEAAIGHSAVQLSSAWQELQDAQVLRDEAMAHDLVADATLRGVPPVVARRVHAQCAQWLAQHGGEPARVARHWQAGGQPQAAAAAFEQAALRARQAARQAEEASLYAQAAQAWADAGQNDARFEALALRVTALIDAQSDEAALAEARALPGQARTDAQRVRGLRVLTDQLGQRGPFEEAVEVGEKGIALARQLGKAPGAQEELVRLIGVTAGNQIKIGRTQQAYSLMLPVRDWVDREADDSLRQIWYGYWAAVLGHTGRLREGVASFDVAIACAQRTGERAVQSMALLNQSVVLRTMGALERAFEGARLGLELSSSDADNANHRLARLMHARNEAETGRFTPAQLALDELLPGFEAMAAPFWVHAVRATQARLWQHLGQHARALQALKLDDSGLPAWMQAGRLWIKLEIEQWLGLPLAVEPARQAVALLDGDVKRRTANAVRGLRFAPPQAVLDQASALAERARSQELFGAMAALQLHCAHAALALKQHEHAVSAARQLLGLLHEGYVPDFVYTPEAWWVAGQALSAAGDEAGARRAWAQGQAWVQRALAQVPAPFIESFLHRNPVNRELLALVATPP